MPRPGTLNAAAALTILARRNAAVKRRPRMLVGLAITVPGIARVNGASTGTFEPGGAYEITGHGFGTRPAAVFLSFGGRLIKLDVASWSDDQIVAAMPDGISGVADLADVTLNVAPRGQHAFTSTKFGFRAAREDSVLPITSAMFSANGTASTRTEDGFFTVSRDVRDTGSTKHCFDEGSDTIRWNAPLKPGFEITGHYWFHSSESASKSAGTSYTPRGKYDLAFEGDFVRIQYGVMRRYTAPYMLLPGSGGCTSEYRVKLIVTGPRGLPSL